MIGKAGEIGKVWEMGRHGKIGSVRNKRKIKEGV